jgi:hypothetical protein
MKALLKGTSQILLVIAGLLFVVGRAITEFTKTNSVLAECWVFYRKVLAWAAISCTYCSLAEECVRRYLSQVSANKCPGLRVST